MWISVPVFVQSIINESLGMRVKCSTLEPNLLSSGERDARPSVAQDLFCGERGKHFENFPKYCEQIPRHRQAFGDVHS